jgi:zinc transporter ZupT
MGLFAIAAPIGYILSDSILTNVSVEFTWLATAFAGGSLLYVAAVDLLPVIHSQSKHKYITVSLFILWVIGMSAVKYFE